MRSRAITPDSPTVTLQVDGRAVTAHRGETLAAALVASGLRIGRHTQGGNPRHVFCAMGACFDCLTIVEGMGAVRACMTHVADGMVVRSWPANGLPALSDLPPLGSLPDGPLPHRRCQLAVVGAGPGGLEAAIAAAEGGVEVVILDERPEPGGQYYEQPAESIRARRDRRASKGATLIARARSLGCEILSGALVWRGTCADGILELAVLHEGNAFYLQPEQLVIATGAYDAPFPVPGWTLPGVLTVGGASSLLRGYGVVPTGPVAVCGNGPLLSAARQPAGAGRCRGFGGRLGVRRVAHEPAGSPAHGPVQSRPCRRRRTVSRHARPAPRAARLRPRDHPRDRNGHASGGVHRPVRRRRTARPDARAPDRGRDRVSRLWVSPVQ